MPHAKERRRRRLSDRRVLRVTQFSQSAPSTTTPAMSNSPITKKRKHLENGQAASGSSHKKAKKDKEQSGKRDEKGKGRATEENADSAFRVVSATVVLSIPPVFSKDLMKGVHEMLDSLIMR